MLMVIFIWILYGEICGVMKMKKKGLGVNGIILLLLGFWFKFMFY